MRSYVPSQRWRKWEYHHTQFCIPCRRDSIWKDESITFCMNKMQSIQFGYTNKDLGRNVGFSTNCIMQPQKAGIYATPLRKCQQKNCACRRQYDTKRALITSVVTVDGVFFVRSQNCKNRLLVSSSVSLSVCLPVPMSVRPHWKIDSLWTDFQERWYMSIFRKSVEKVRDSLKIWQD